MRKKLWRIFGPVVVAVIIVGLILFWPAKSQKLSNQIKSQAATSLAPTVLKGTQVKQTTLKDHRFVPFFGSSELSRFDLTHPAVLAQKYHRDYQPFLMGSAGTQSLTHYYQMQSILPELHNRQAVFIISPQWFVKKGADPKAFNYYFSREQALSFLKNQTGSTADKYAAKRLLKMPKNNLNTYLKGALTKIANGQKVDFTRSAYFRAYDQMLTREDQLFSHLPTGNNERKIAKSASQLPAEDDQAQLTTIINRQAKKATDSNSFGIKNGFYHGRLQGKIGEFKNFERHFDYRQSPEFADFQLVLSEFAKEKTNVLFIIPPVNQKWATYTGLSQKMLRGFDRKIRYQLQSQGFNHILDLTNDGGKSYYMEDTIHLGWNGWRTVDHRVQPFLQTTQTQPTYQLDNHFFSQAWQDLAPTSLTKYQQEKQ